MRSLHNPRFLIEAIPFLSRRRSVFASIVPASFIVSLIVRSRRRRARERERERGRERVRAIEVVCADAVR